MEIRRKKQHKCKSIREYRQILYIYNPESALHFRDSGWLYFQKMFYRLHGI